MIKPGEYMPIHGEVRDAIIIVPGGDVFFKGASFPNLAAALRAARDDMSALYDLAEEADDGER